MEKKLKASHQHLNAVVLFSYYVVESNSLKPYRLQHTRLPCPSISPGVCSNSYPLSQWCPPTISSSVVPFSSCPPSFPASGSFPVSQLFASGGRVIGASASASILPVNIRGWYPLGLTGLLSLLLKEPSRVFWNNMIIISTLQIRKLRPASPSNSFKITWINT